MTQEKSTTPKPKPNEKRKQRDRPVKDISKSKDAKPTEPVIFSDWASI